MKADTEEQVITLLSEAGYWTEPNCWRCFGDNELNYSTIGNQQSRSDAALVEKLVNSVDACLMGGCYRFGIDPESNEAPPDIRFAVAKFIEKSPVPKKDNVGKVANWTASERTEVSRQITLAATGARSNPSFTIVDSGEGQTPDRVPETLMSLTKANKLKIPFVQGKFNMGGTGALRFCGSKGMQLVLTRRDPDIVDPNSESVDDWLWSFTVVRRDDPRVPERSSVYRYLAPIDAETNSGYGRVLRFSAEKLPLFPEMNEAYEREATHGTLIKLYEYQARGYLSHILLTDGLLNRIDLLLPDPALPVRFHECRDYKGGSGSFDTTLTGLSVRLSDDRGHNMEEGFPASCPITVNGQRLTATIFAFKKGKADTYRKNEGVIFVLNGQTHATLDIRFFRLKKVGLSYLANSLLVKIDCSRLNLQTIEKLFMNSRDRLNNDSEIHKLIVDGLSRMLKEHENLRELKNKRREEEIAEKLEDNKPLAETLRSILQQSPALTSLFLTGDKLSDPFKTKKVKSEDVKFTGQRYPTFFRFKGKDYGFRLERDCHLSSRCRLAFETDAENEYFSRDDDPGSVSVMMFREGVEVTLDNYVGPYPTSGMASLTFDLPPGVKVGDQLVVNVEITDGSRVEPFVNVCDLTVLPFVRKPPHPPKPPKPPTDKDGKDRTIESGIALPNIIPVKEEEWGDRDPPFDKFTALRITLVGDGENDEGGNKEATVYDFFVNEDNFYLKSDLKSAGENEELVKTRFTHGMVLTGLALLHQHEQKISETNNSEESAQSGDVESIESRVEETTKALAPFIVPMIEALGAIEITEDYVEESGE